MVTGKEDLLQALIEAYLMENGSREFYSQAARKSGMPAASRTFGELAAWEEKHMEFIQYLYQAIMEDRDVKGFEEFKGRSSTELAEGGIPVKDIEKKLEAFSITGDKDAITLALEIEEKAYSFYSELQQKAADTNAKEIFKDMMEQEIKHVSHLKKMMTQIAQG